MVADGLVSAGGGEKQQCIVDGHAQNVMDVFALIGDFQNVVLKSLAPAVFTNQFQIGHELHAYCDVSFTFTCFTSSSRNVEAEMRWFEAAGLGMGGVGQEGTYFVKGLDVRHRIGTGAFANRVLVDKFEVLQRTQITFNGTDSLGVAAKTIQFGLDGGHQQLRDQGAFA